MQTSIYWEESLLNGRENNGRSLFSSLGISILLHTALISLVVLMPYPSDNRIYEPSVISVTMVSAPGTAMEPEPGEMIREMPEPTEIPEAAVEEPPPEATAVVAEDTLKYLDEPKPIVQDPEPPVQVIPKPVDTVVVKDAPAKEAVEADPKPDAPQPVENEAPKIIKRSQQAVKPQKSKEKVVTPEDLRSKSIKDAINRVRNKVSKEEGAAKTSGGMGSQGTGSPGGAVAGISDIYRAQVGYQIEKHWAFSGQLARGQQNLLAVVVVKILSSGHIQDVWFEKKSGNPNLDDSAYRAVMKSNPLPPLPQGYPEYTVALRFTPSGLN